MNDYPNVPVGKYAGDKLATIGGSQMMNPTLRENIDQKIQYMKDEIVRLEAIKEKLPNLLDVNLRDLREAMNF